MAKRAQKLIDGYTSGSNPFVLVEEVHGKDAVRLANKLLFKDSKGTEGSKNWSASEQAKAVFFVVARKTKSNKMELRIKFVIGDSVLGERVKVAF